MNFSTWYFHAALPIFPKSDPFSKKKEFQNFMIYSENSKDNNVLLDVNQTRLC